jgi:hypothetical protein
MAVRHLVFLMGAEVAVAESGGRGDERAGGFGGGLNGGSDLPGRVCRFTIVGEQSFDVRLRGSSKGRGTSNSLGSNRVGTRIRPAWAAARICSSSTRASRVRVALTWWTAAITGGTCSGSGARLSGVRAI